MNYLKSILAGIATAIISVMLLVAAMLGFVAWQIDAPESGVVALIVGPLQISLVAVTGFALGFWLSVSKQRHRLRACGMRFVIVPLVLAALGMIWFLWFYFRPTFEWEY